MPERHILFFFCSFGFCFSILPCLVSSCLGFCSLSLFAFLFSQRYISPSIVVLILILHVIDLSINQNSKMNTTRNNREKLQYAYLRPFITEPYVQFNFITWVITWSMKVNMQSNVIKQQYQQQCIADMLVSLISILCKKWTVSCSCIVLCSVVSCFACLFYFSLHCWHSLTAAWKFAGRRKCTGKVMPSAISSNNKNLRAN